MPSEVIAVVIALGNPKDVMKKLNMNAPRTIKVTIAPVRAVDSVDSTIILQLIFLKTIARNNDPITPMAAVINTFNIYNISSYICF